MFRWTQESINWIDQAADYTGYYKKLADIIKEELLPLDNICEIACGTGHLAMELAKYVNEINAVDINKQVIEFASKRKELLKRGTEGGRICFTACDWREFCTDKKFDVILFTYFGIDKELWDNLINSTKRSIIAALPFEKAWERPSHFKKEKSKTNRKKDNVETVERLIELLEESRFNYDVKNLTLEFGQPFYEEKDIDSFFNHYYPSMDEEKRLEKRNKIEKRGEISYLPKKKNLAIITAKR